MATRTHTHERLVSFVVRFFFVGGFVSLSLSLSLSLSSFLFFLRIARFLRRTDARRCCLVAEDRVRKENRKKIAEIETETETDANGDRLGDKESKKKIKEKK